MKAPFFFIACCLLVASCSDSKLPLKGSPESLLPKIYLSLGNVTLDGLPVRVGSLLAKSGSLETPIDGYLDFTFDGKNVIHCDAATKLDFVNEEGRFIINLKIGKLFVIRSSEKSTNLSRKVVINSGGNTLDCPESYLYIVADGSGKTYLDVFKGGAVANGLSVPERSSYYLTEGKIEKAPAGLFNGITIATQSTERARVKGIF